MEDDEIIEATAKVSPLDPDFILIFFFAMLVDGADIFFELSGIGKPFGAFFDVFTFMAIAGWMSWRMGRIAENKRARQEAARQRLQQTVQKLEKLKKVGEIDSKTFDRYMRRYSRQMGRGGRMAARIARKPLTRALMRGAVFFLGEIIFLVGLVPFWLIAVVLMLREK